MKMKHIIIVAALILICVISFSFWRFCERYPVPPWVAHKARQRISLVQAGMTSDQMWKILGLSHYDFFKEAEGSGPPNAFPMNYELWYGDDLYCVWDTTKQPMVVREARFKNSIYDK